MTDQEEAARRAEVIEQVDHWIAKAREALDLKGWAERNGFDLEQVLARARAASNASDLTQVQREAEAQMNEIEQGMRESLQPARPTAAAPASLRTRARL